MAGPAIKNKDITAAVAIAKLQEFSLIPAVQSSDSFIIFPPGTASIFSVSVRDKGSIRRTRTFQSSFVAMSTPCLHD